MCLAYPAEVVSVDDGAATVLAAGRLHRVITVCLDDRPPMPGDWLLVQSGLALTHLSEEQRHELSK